MKDTFECGQCFRWTDDGNGYTGIASGHAARFVQGDGCIYAYGTSLETLNSFWLRYLALDADYSSALSLRPDDEYLKKAAEFGKGIRILRQEPCETILSFIISSNNNIKRIRKIIEKFCSLFGKPLVFEDKKCYTFPVMDDLEAITPEGLSLIKAGFRDKYLMDAATKLLSGDVDTDMISSLDTDAARKELMKIKGVGPKVADCALLFGFGRTEAFPKDVWIKRVMTDIYGSDFDERMFGTDAGIIQQWLFHYARNGVTSI